MKRIRVGVVGYGTIGKRVADAVRAQPDMTLVGVGIRSPSSAVAAGTWLGIPFFCTEEERFAQLKAAGLIIRGDLGDLLDGVDVIVDCAQSGQAEKRWNLYTRASVRAIFQGGEKHDKVGFTFSTFANYEEAIGRAAARVASCNTTGLVRLLSVVRERWGISSAHAALVRCASDPNKATKGVVNSAAVVAGPSHHARDVQLLLPDIPIYTQAVAVPMTHGHLGMVALALKTPANRREVLDVLQHSPRVLVEQTTTRQTTSQLSSHFAAAGRRRGDRPELLVWEESLQVTDASLYALISIHMEAIVVPETIDCIRAMTGREGNRAACLWQTDQALGIAKVFCPPGGNRS